MGFAFLILLMGKQKTMVWNSVLQVAVIIILHHMGCGYLETLTNIDNNNQYIVVGCKNILMKL